MQIELGKRNDRSGRRPKGRSRKCPKKGQKDRSGALCRFSMLACLGVESARREEATSCVNAVSASSNKMQNGVCHSSHHPGRPRQREHRAWLTSLAVGSGQLGNDERGPCYGKFRGICLRAVLSNDGKRNKSALTVGCAGTTLRGLGVCGSW